MARFRYCRGDGGVLLPFAQKAEKMSTSEALPLLNSNSKIFYLLVLVTETEIKQSNGSSVMAKRLAKRSSG
jgi:hypothetical protein